MHTGFGLQHRSACFDEQKINFFKNCNMGDFNLL